jgi:radical SAM protein with 4Fe4S-binding SPASM domain
MISAAAIGKCLPPMLRHPWIGSKLAGLQIEKWLFGAFHRNGTDGRAGKIRQLSFRITDLCNLRCRTCGQWGESGYLHGHDLKALKQREVPLARYQELLHDLVRHGHRPMVYLWGGEPMLYEGTPALVETATTLELPVAIATNGSRIASHAARFVKAPMFLLQISIDGHCAEAHNRIRPGIGDKDSFSEILAALDAVHVQRQLQGSSLPLVASLTVISRQNCRHLTDIYQAFRDRVDMFVFYLSWWIDEDSACAHDHDFSRRFGFLPTRHKGWIGDWRPDDYAGISEQLDELSRLSRSWSSPPVILIPDIADPHDLRTYYTDHRERFGFNQCISIYQAMEVNSNGDVSPCRDYNDYVVGNAKTATLTELWNSQPYRRFRKSLSQDGLMPVCTRCCGLMGY